VTTVKRAAGEPMVKFYLDDEEYNLTTRQSDLVEAEDKKYPLTEEGNIAFNEWFREFAKKEGIFAVNRRMARYWTKSFNDKDDKVKLAVTLRAMRSVVSVVDSKNANNITYSDSAMTSAWADNRIVLPSSPVKEAADLHESIDTMSGFAVHEACHSKYTRKILPKDRDELLEALKTPNFMAAMNILEDCRIEPLEVAVNPGFARNLKRTSDYLWDTQKPLESIASDFASAKGEDKFQAAITAMRRPQNLGGFDPSWQPFLGKAKDLGEEYTKLGEAANWRTLQKFGHRLLDLLDLEEDEENKQFETILMPCNIESDLDFEDVNEIQELVDDEIEKLDKSDKKWMTPPDMTEAPEIYVRRPSRGISNKKPVIGGLMAKAKAALELRRAAPRNDTRMMLSGELDEDELYRLFNDDPRVFRDITEEVEQTAAVTLLVDWSGSMNAHFSGTERRYEVAYKMAYVLASALASKRNVKARVLMHTGDNELSSLMISSSANFYRIWESGEDIRRLTLMHSIERGENYDGFAIAWAGNMMVEEEFDQRLLVVLSDGQPNGRRYAGPTAERHVRAVVDALAKRGVEVVQLSMSTDLSEAAQARMFKRYVSASSIRPYDTLLQGLQRVLLRLNVLGGK
jgi:hypothetical protein